MRKTYLMGLGLALSLAGVAAAQQPQKDASRRDKGDHGQAGGRGVDGRGGPRGLLLKDIKLTETQKTQLKTLRKTQHDQMAAGRDQQEKQREDIRAARQRGDTAAVRAITARNRQVMEQARAQEIAAIRNILTAEQRVQFERNVAALQQRESERAQRVGQRGEKGGGRKDGQKGRPGPGRQS